MTHDTLMALAAAYANCLYCDRNADEARATLSAALTELVAERDEHQTNAMRNAQIAVNFKAERDALANDAARYRWLRHGDNDEGLVSIIRSAADADPCAFLLRNTALDEAIDAAMKGTPT